MHFIETELLYCTVKKVQVMKMTRDFRWDKLTIQDKFYWLCLLEIRIGPRVSK